MSDTSARNGKVVVNRCMSLDGFIAAPGHVMDWGAGRQLTDFVARPRIDGDELDRERGVVIQEIARYWDQPSSVADTPPMVRVPVGPEPSRSSVTCASGQSIVTFGSMVPQSLEAAERLAAEGVDAEVVDLRTLMPLDLETVVASVARSEGRVWTFANATRQTSRGRCLVERAFQRRSSSSC